MARRILQLSATLLVVGACSSSPDATTGPGAIGEASAESAPATTAPPATLSEPVTRHPPDDPYCLALASLDNLDAVQELAGADPAEIQTAVDVAGAAMGQVTVVAPEAVRTDWATLASVYGELFSAYRESGFDVTALMADPSASGVFERFGAREVLDAGDRVEQHGEAACGIALGLGRSVVVDEPELAATDTTSSGAALSDLEAADLGRRFLEEFSLGATPDQQACVGRAVSDPAMAAAIEDPITDALGRYRELAATCGIDTSPID